MSDGYTKLFSDIVDSSIWDEDAAICKVWVTLLALSNAEGFVRGSVPWLANKSKVSVDVCQQALTKFTSPDPISRTLDNEGRRIQAVDSGWIVLNHHIFRSRSGLSQDPRRAYQREWMRKKRLIRKSQQSQQESTPASASVTYEVSKAPTRSEKKTPSLEEVKLCCAKTGLPESDAVWFWNKCEGNGWTNSGKPIRSWKHTIASWNAARYMPSQKAPTQQHQPTLRDYIIQP